jgi:hypothetical protein
VEARILGPSFSSGGILVLARGVEVYMINE